ncbi:DUF883 family protein [Noviherbaspirillum autotrophicum]|uniref:DUF883 domain-containing protein n=1 Tax=Noviherbaspirillum autotrophicum TaxID=709839 RepID=A0A0C2BT46_9BURK|nr:DUF883 family protein [Noviherbaspirillum autotrophicum]KIF81231.1 hypothetical protein TSA66_11020 [Noviherbaspirillum autotrophicum]
MDTTQQGTDVRNRLVNDLKLVIKDAEELLRSSGQQVDVGYQAARAKFESTVSNAKSGLTSLQGNVFANSREALANTNQYVQEHPWQSVSVGALAGLVLGMWLGRR